jgi:Flp pilus assembly protein TadG
MRRERGTTTVEFAIIGSAAMLVLFSIIEVSRLVFTISVLGEVTRRGARMAAVCPVNDPAIAGTAVFSRGGGRVLPNLGVSNIRVEYLAANGSVVADPVGGFANISQVRVGIMNFEHQMLIPFSALNVVTPTFTTTLPRESLGIPRQGEIFNCAVG